MPQSPDALSRQQAARQVIVRLQACQEQRLHLELLMVANDHEDTASIPGAEAKRENGQFVYDDGQPVFPTYRESMAELAAAEARVMAFADGKDLMRLVVSMLTADREAAP